jgi:plastocyanin
MKRFPVLIGLLFLCSVLGGGFAQAHSADTFTVVIKQSALTPSSSQIAYNDSVIWHNTDSRDNITHRIVLDFDGDGLYNGTDDWDSGELVSECDTASTENGSENGSEDSCNVTFLVWFNGTWGIGEYNYQDMLSDGTVMNGTVVVTEDVHIENSSAPAVGTTFGVSENDETEETPQDDANDDDLRRMILLVGMGSGVGAAGLLVLLLMRRSGNDVINMSDEEA